MDVCVPWRCKALSTIGEWAGFMLLLVSGSMHAGRLGPQTRQVWRGYDCVRLPPSQQQLDAQACRKRAIFWAQVTTPPASVEDVHELLKSLNDPELRGVNTCDECQRTALHLIAAFPGLLSSACAEILLRSVRFNVADASDVLGNTALHYAAQEGNERTVFILLDNPYFTVVNRTNKKGVTAFQVAASKGQLGVVKEMLAFKPSTSDVSVPSAGREAQELRLDGWDFEGKTAMHHALAGGHAEIARFILQDARYTNHSTRDVCGQTPLHLAAARADTAAVAFDLLRRPDAELNARDMSGRTALHWAADASNEEVACALVADARLTVETLNARDDDRDSVWDIAKRRNLSTVLAALRANKDFAARPTQEWMPVQTCGAGGAPSRMCGVQEIEMSAF